MSFKNQLKPVAYKIFPKSFIDFIKLIKTYIYEKKRKKKF